MNRSVVNLLLTAAFACVGSSAVIAQQPDTEQQINEPGKEVVTHVVTTEISEEEMRKISEFLRDFSQHNLDGELFSIIVSRVTAGSDVTKEQITLPLEVLFAMADPNHCYGKVDDPSETANDGDLSNRSVWCQRPDYKQWPRADRQLEWDMYLYGNPLDFDYEENDALKCFRKGEPNVILTQDAHDKLCHGKL